MKIVERTACSSVSLSPLKNILEKCQQNVTIEGLSLAIQDLIGDRPHRETMSKKGQQLVDGNGAKRVVSAMVSMLD